MEGAGSCGQKVVVIHDASKDVVSRSTISWLLKGSLVLEPGDELILVGILHYLNNPMGFRSKIDSSIFGANPVFVEEQVSMKKEEYLKSVHILQLFTYCTERKIKFQVEVKAGYSPKAAALEAAETYGATWVILDRYTIYEGRNTIKGLEKEKEIQMALSGLQGQMKKDKTYFLEKLSCRISKMKRNNTFEPLRGPKSISPSPPTDGKPSTISLQVTYGDMIPGSRSQKQIDRPEKKSESTQKEFSRGGTEQGHHSDGGSPHKINQKLPLPKSSLSLSDCVSKIEVKIVTSSKQKGSPLESKEDILLKGKQSPNIIILADQERGVPTGTISSRLSPNEVEQKQWQISDDLDDQVSWIRSSKSDNEDEDEVIGSSICFVCKNRRPPPKIELRKEYSYAELYEATKGFSSENFLSEGGFGSVYRGELRNGLKVAVKQHKDVSFQGEKEFKSEVQVLSKARHRNLVMLLGSCTKGNHKLLVYEYVCNGSLDQQLSKHSRKPLNWDKRIKIALGAAKGLEYLHRNNILHRDVRPSNILLTHDHDSLLGDFGLARNQCENDLDNTDNLVGTLGYLAPEYVETGKASTKTDVYSFGIVLLQLITGLGTTDGKINGGKSLIEWDSITITLPKFATPFYSTSSIVPSKYFEFKVKQSKYARPLLEEKNYPDLIDKRLLETHDMYQLFWMVRVAERCLANDPRKRWTMESVVDALNCIIKGETASIRDFSPAHIQFDSGVSLSSSMLDLSPNKDSPALQERKEEDYSDGAGTWEEVKKTNILTTTTSSGPQASSSRTFSPNTNPIHTSLRGLLTPLISSSTRSTATSGAPIHCADSPRRGIVSLSRKGSVNYDEMII